MKQRITSYYFLLTFLVMILQGCIHEYPTPVKGSNEKGENPSLFTASIEVSYDLTWENMLHQAEFSTKTKGRTESPHRFIIEVIKNGEVICHDVKYLTPNEFSLGKLTHKISANLEPSLFQLAVWYDRQNEDGEYPYLADNLNGVSLINFSTRDVESLQCAYGSDLLDLSDYEYSDKEVTIKKELELQHPGARFEIVATDIQQFITNNKASLNQGDTFTVFLSCASGVPVGFDLHSENLLYGENPLELSGEMRLPFAAYDELKIAEGFIFCKEEQNITLKLSVKNSSLITVSQTDYFSFPIKQGNITTVYGDFLTNPIDGIFSIDNIWEGEIVIEI